MNKNLKAENPAEIERLIKEYWNGWEKGIEEGGDFYSKEADINIWDGTAVEEPGWNAYEKELVPWMEQVDVLSNEAVGDLQVFQ